MHLDNKSGKFSSPAVVSVMEERKQFKNSSEVHAASYLTHRR